MFLKELNTTIKNAEKLFAIGSNGRFVYVDIYPKRRDDCMKMEVVIKTRVEHPDTLEPGVTPLKWKLSIPEAPPSRISVSRYAWDECGFRRQPEVEWPTSNFRLIAETTTQEPARRSEKRGGGCPHPFASLSIRERGNQGL
jgi:hypothetical protein